MYSGQHQRRSFVTPFGYLNSCLSDVAPGPGILSRKRDQQWSWCGAGCEWLFVEVEGIVCQTEKQKAPRNDLPARSIRTWRRSDKWVQADGHEQCTLIRVCVCES
jgi:hypothetical protein